MTNLQKQNLGSENFFIYLVISLHIVRKWNGTDFSVDNFIEEGERFLDSEGHALPDGEHPTIHWNRFTFTILFMKYCYRICF